MSFVRRLATGAVAFATACGGLVAFAAPSHAVDPPRNLFGLTTSNQLVRFTDAAPGSPSAPVSITGLQSGETLHGIDFRAETGQLYGVGSTSRLYTLNPSTGAATVVGSLPFVPPLSGSAFGFDFNPVIDEVRILSETDQNLRVHPSTGVASLDSPVVYHPVDPNTGADPNVVALAYTNNTFTAASTTAYGIDYALDILVNHQGTDHNVVATVGALGVDVTSLASMDVADKSGVAYAALNTTGNPSALYTINLATGAATPLGGLGTLTLRGLTVGPVGQIRLSGSSYSNNEDGGVVTISVFREGGSFGTATVAYTTTAGSATAGSDYTTTSGTLTFVEGDTSEVILVPLLEDNVVEAAETFTITLSSPTAAALGSPSVATVTITDDEGLAYGVTSANGLFEFPPTDPGDASSPMTITGLQVSEDVLAIDFRPATGVLYAIGDTGRLYTINTSTAAATQVGAPFALTFTAAIGMDFNPTSDRIRVVTDGEQNLSIHPDTAVVTAQSALAYDGSDVNTGDNPNVVGAAYTDNVPFAMTTTLYDIDSVNDVLVTQVPATGVLNTVGPLGVDVTDGAFDISAGGLALAALTPNAASTSTLYTVDLVTGGLTAVGGIAVGTTVVGMSLAPAGVLGVNPAVVSVGENAVTATVTVTRTGGAFGEVKVNYATANGTATAGSDYTSTSGTLTFANGDTSESFTIPITQDPRAEPLETILVNLSAPTHGAVLSPVSGLVQIEDDDATLYAIDDEGKILTFTAGTMAVPTEVAVTGLQTLEELLAIDVRPSTGTLYALGSTGRLYSLNPTTGVASLVGSGPLSPAPSGGAFGFDFNPVVDRLRIVSDTEQNLRVDVDTGTVTVDGPLVYALADVEFGTDPNVAGSAYTNSLVGAASTTLYGIDSGTDQLVIQNPANAGVLNTVGALGVDTDGRIGFDIAAAGGTAFASLTPNAGVTSTLFTINLTTGAATAVAPIGGGAPLFDIAIARPQTTFQIVPSSATPVSGATQTVTVTAKLPNTSTDTTYTGTPTLTSSDAVFAPGTCSAAVLGQSTCTGVMFGDLGSQRLSAVDTTWGIGSSTTVVTQPTGLTFSTVPDEVASIGEELLFVVAPTAGVGGASITGYTATRTLTVTGDAPAPEVTPLTCASATCSFTVEFDNSGEKTVQVTDNSTPPRSTVAYEILVKIPTAFEAFGTTKSVAVAGETIGVGGFLVDDETGDPIDGASVRIYAKTFPSTTFKLWRTLTTDEDGFFLLAGTMVRNSVFQAVYLPPGSTDFERADSALVGVSVRTRVTMTSPANGARISFGRPLAVRGYTFPAKSGTRAVLYQKLTGGGVRALGAMTIRPNGTFALDRPLSRGTYVLYVAVPAVSGNVTGYSNTFTIRVV